MTSPETEEDTYHWQCYLPWHDIVSRTCVLYILKNYYIFLTKPCNGGITFVCFIGPVVFYKKFILL